MFCRFQKLREIIPNSDQKRDKASFLLEVTGEKINYPFKLRSIYSILKPEIVQHVYRLSSTFSFYKRK